jgi:hypothetical protein
MAVDTIDMLLAEPQQYSDVPRDCSTNLARTSRKPKVEDRRDSVDMDAFPLAFLR